MVPTETHHKNIALVLNLTALWSTHLNVSHYRIEGFGSFLTYLI